MFLTHAFCILFNLLYRSGVNVLIDNTWLHWSTEDMNEYPTKCSFCDQGYT